MRSQSIICQNSQGQHLMRYWEWGAEENPNVVICVHGLTRNGRDFDLLAEALAANYRVICPDVVGRGESDWLDNPEDYAYPQYVADMLSLLAALNLSSVQWVGTSMGGIIGMFIAAQADTPIKKLILNDIGAFVPQSALQRIAEYLVLPPKTFPNLAMGEQHLRRVHAPFGQLSDQHWQRLTKNSLRALSSGEYRFAYDPAIAYPFQQLASLQEIEAVDLSPVWAAITCPVALICGEQSDIVTEDIRQTMQADRPDMPVEMIKEVGHAPMLLETAQIEIIKDWLQA